MNFFIQYRWQAWTPIMVDYQPNEIQIFKNANPACNKDNLEFTMSKRIGRAFNVLISLDYESLRKVIRTKLNIIIWSYYLTFRIINRSLKTEDIVFCEVFSNCLESKLLIINATIEWSSNQLAITQFGAIVSN